MSKGPLISHVDVRVRDRARAVAFYDPLLLALGFVADDVGKHWNTYSDKGWREGGPAPDHFFGFTEDSTMVPGSTRIAFAAESRLDVDRIAALLPEIGAKTIEGPEEAYGPNYYAVFFEDPDGNKLEVCFLGS